jgi:hypothetical protein
MWSKVRLTGKMVMLGMAAALCLGLVQIGAARPAQSEMAKTSKDVYVCACMKDKSCLCMGMSNKAGKCTCGDEMKAVPRDSAWAKHNRKELK